MKWKRKPCSQPCSQQRRQCEHSMEGWKMVQEPRNIFKEGPLYSKVDSKKDYQEAEVSVRTMQTSLITSSAPVWARKATDESSRA